VDTWCLFIKNDMKARIGTADDLPAKLTLQGLAEHYNVSLTPVRQAINELIGEQYLSKRGNGRLIINPSQLGTWDASADEVRPEPPKDYFDEIHEDVVLLCLRGEAVFLREEDTAAKYGLSGTAIRRILSRLAGSGIVEHIPRRGWRVRPFHQEQLIAYTKVRKVLEVEAMKEAWPNLVDEDLQAILDCNILPDNDEEEAMIDDGIHEYLIEKSGNEYIRDFLERHMRFFTVIFEWEGSDRQAAIDTVHQHRRLLEALLKRDRREAQKALLDHLDYDHAFLKKTHSRGKITEVNSKYVEN